MHLENSFLLHESSSFQVIKARQYAAETMNCKNSSLATVRIWTSSICQQQQQQVYQKTHGPVAKTNLDSGRQGEKWVLWEEEKLCWELPVQAESSGCSWIGEKGSPSEGGDDAITCDSDLQR